VPPTVPTQPLAAGERWLVRVGEFPGHTDRGLIWDAEIVPSIRLFELGGNEVTITCPASDHNMRVLGDPIGGYTQAGLRLYSTKQAIKRELIVGSTLTGKARWRFVIRDPWEVSGSTITIKAKGIVGGLTSDRVIGAPTRNNKLDPIGTRRGSFEHGDLTGWRVVGTGCRRRRCLRWAGRFVQGVDHRHPEPANYIEARYRWVQGAVAVGTPAHRSQRARATAWLRDRHRGFRARADRRSSTWRPASRCGPRASPMTRTRNPRWVRRHAPRLFRPEPGHRDRKAALAAVHRRCLGAAVPDR
jgi:hypothetical protein